MRVPRRGLLAASLLLTLLGALPAQASAPAARRGAAWLTRHAGARGDGQAADALAALRAAGALPRGAAVRRAAALRRGARSYAVTAGAAGKVLLGLTAAGVGNPRCAGTLDLARAVSSRGRGGRYGSSAYDQAYAMLGLRAAGLPVGRSAVGFLRRARHGGGWDFSLRGGQDDPSATALVVMALRAAGVSRRDGALRAAMAWLDRDRTPAGGFAISGRARNESNSTALVLEAEHVMGRSTTRAARALQGLQRGDGAYQFTATQAGSLLLSTNDAVVAAAGRALPVSRRARPAPGC